MFLVSGMNTASRTSPGMSCTLQFRYCSFLLSIITSFICIMPMILSMSSRYTGNLELLPPRTNSRTSHSCMLPSTAATFLRWVIISLASLSSNSKILWIISASLACSTPCSCPSLTMEIISSSVTSSKLALGSTPTIRTTRLETASAKKVYGFTAHAITRTMPATANSHFSDFLAAIFCGAIIPKTANRKIPSTAAAA